MTRLDQILVDKVAKIILKYGKDCILTKPVTNDINAFTGEIQDNTATSQSVKCTPPMFETEFDQSVGFKQVGTTLLSPVGITDYPEEGQRLSFDGRDWFITSVMTIYSGDQIVAFELGIST